MIDKNKMRKFVCPVHDDQIRMLNFNVTLALCHICYRQMVPADGNLANTNKQVEEGLDKWKAQK
jgi:hypothetical protein